MARRSDAFVCAECGARFARWSGRCPNCEKWDTLERATHDLGRDAAAKSGAVAAPVPLREISTMSQGRFSCGMPEFDRVLGGGVLPGSTILLGGEPGIGKSTILLQAMGKLSARGVQCLYVTCEESLPQIKLRAARLGLDDSPLRVSAETSLAGILALLEAEAAQAVAVDSVQRVVESSLESAPGSLKQVSTCATALTEACKARGVALFLVGHVTKQGLLAGPRALEHLVDTVLYFESERFQTLRILRAAKNRFGAINEIGVFEMGSEGLKEVANPSKLFLAERNPDACGSVVTAAMEGSRALLVEVQALVGQAAYGTPERKASGLDHRRFSMMMSVLARQGELEVNRCDAFVNVAGGVRVHEPGADLPMILALASSFLNRPFPGDAVALGEVGLGGEVRAVGRVVERLKEARKLGFSRAVVPAGNAGAAAQLGFQCDVVKDLKEAVRTLQVGRRRRLSSKASAP